MRNTLRLPAIILVLALVLILPQAIQATTIDDGSAIQPDLNTAIALIEATLEPGQEILALEISSTGDIWYAAWDTTAGTLLNGSVSAGTPYAAYSPQGNPPGGKGNPGGPNPNGGNPGGGNPPGGKGNPGGPNPNGGNPGGGNPPGGNPAN